MCVYTHHTLFVSCACVGKSYHTHHTQTHTLTHFVCVYVQSVCVDVYLGGYGVYVVCEECLHVYTRRTYTHIHTCKHNTHTQIHTNTTHTHIHKPTQIRTYSHKYAHTHTYTTHTYTNTHILTPIHTHTHTYTHTP